MGIYFLYIISLGQNRSKTFCVVFFFLCVYFFVFSSLLLMSIIRMRIQHWMWVKMNLFGAFLWLFFAGKYYFRQISEIQFRTRYKSLVWCRAVEMRKCLVSGDDEICSEYTIWVCQYECEYGAIFKHISASMGSDLFTWCKAAKCMVCRMNMYCIPIQSKLHIECFIRCGGWHRTFCLDTNINIKWDCMQYTLRFSLSLFLSLIISTHMIVNSIFWRSAYLFVLVTATHLFWSITVLVACLYRFCHASTANCILRVRV